MNPEIVPKLSRNFHEMIQKIVLKLSQNCPKIVPKMSENCPKIVPKLFHKKCVNLIKEIMYFQTGDPENRRTGENSDVTLI